jgi:hypothetical protein
VQHLSLHHTIAGHALGFDDDSVAVVFVVLLAGLGTQTHTLMVDENRLRSRTKVGTPGRSQGFSLPP